MNNIYLIGMMGSGKSVVAAELARKLSRSLVDLDTLIVRHEGCSINTIFREKGEPYFRTIERTVLERAATEQSVVVATGGGIILDEHNITTMRATGIMIYLKADSAVLYERLKDKDDRPLLKVAQPQEALEALFRNRAALYEKAQYTIETSQKSVAAVVAEIIPLLTNEGIL